MTTPKLIGDMTRIERRRLVGTWVDVYSYLKGPFNLTYPDQAIIMECRESDRLLLVVSTDPNYDTRFVSWDSVMVRPDIRRAWNSDGTPIIVEDGE